MFDKLVDLILNCTIEESYIDRQNGTHQQVLREQSNKNRSYLFTIDAKTGNIISIQRQGTLRVFWRI